MRCSHCEAPKLLVLRSEIHNCKKASQMKVQEWQQHKVFVNLLLVLRSEIHNCKKGGHMNVQEW